MAGFVNINISLYVRRIVTMIPASWSSPSA